MRTFYRQEADGRLSSLDSDKDSKVSWGEYVKGAENRDGKHCDTSYKPPCPLAIMMTQCFDFAVFPNFHSF